MDWTLLLKAFCLVLVLEGIPLFLAPRRMRAAAALILQMNDRSLRTLGLVSMLIGAGLMFVLAH